MTLKLFGAGFVLGAIMLDVGSAHASVGSVKVDCFNNCNDVSVGQACDTYVLNSLPIAIACDDTATPGAGRVIPCGNGSRTTCTPFGTIFRSDRIGAYCVDGSGNDVVVTCSTTPMIAASTGAESSQPGADQKQVQTTPTNEAGAGGSNMR